MDGATDAIVAKVHYIRNTEQSKMGKQVINRNLHVKTGRDVNICLDGATDASVTKCVF